MIMENALLLQMLSDQKNLQLNSGEEGLRVRKRDLEELGSMLREQQQRSIEISDRERDLNSVYRSGSAPPTVDGSLMAMNGHRNYMNGGLVEEDIIRMNPDYMSYYYSQHNMNPRLPPPMLSKEDWRHGQRLHGGNGNGNSSVAGAEEDKRKNDLIGDGSQPDLSSLGARAKSLADFRQEDLGRPTSFSGRLPRPVSCNAVDNVVNPMSSCDSQLAQLYNGIKPPDALYSRVTATGLVRNQCPGSAVPHSSSSTGGSLLSRSTNPEAQIIGRSSGHCLSQEGGRIGATDKKNIVGSNGFNRFPSSMPDSDLAATLSGLSLSENRRPEVDSHVHRQFQQEFDDQRNFLFDMLNGGDQSLLQHLTDQSKAERINNSTTYNDLAKSNGTIADLNGSKISYDGQMTFTKANSANLPSGINSAGSASLEGSSVQHQIVDKPKSCSVINGYNQRLNPVLNNSSNTGMNLARNAEENNLNRRENQVGSGLRARSDPLFVQNLRRTCNYSAHTMPSLSDPFLEINDVGTSNADLVEFQKAYWALLAQQKQQYNMSMLSKSGALGNGYYGSHAFDLGMPYLGAPMGTSLLSPIGPGSPIWQNEQLSCFPSMMRNSTAGSLGSWHLNNCGNPEESLPSSLLEEFKNNKARSFELSEIVNHVVEFSADQYGSRFIQQKLETATVEEKNRIFKEIMPHARTLMTDVFGNYVIQKFFEHGTETQRKELSGQLTDHVLPLSLQMYGCRVIQKALEVVDVDRQAQMVAELDGSVMKCIRDQNGNHVIQKCIECVPQDRIQFIISSFYGQVVDLSTHPYGCRVIQRVLEYCNDANTQHVIMQEILQSACALAQDQYGNYVVQHVLQHGKPHERSTIINELAGQIVKMSQQKFASNVVEKCLTFGGPEERQLLVNEMLGSTDENEPLQAMMKDQFANYVVQKLLETCDSHSRELILSRIKVHLNALKRFTYGKHIVARVEKLINTEERRIGISSSYSY